jgi:hypothetical protein
MRAGPSRPSCTNNAQRIGDVPLFAMDRFTTDLLIVFQPVIFAVCFSHAAGLGVVVMASFDRKSNVAWFAIYRLSCMLVLPRPKAKNSILLTVEDSLKCAISHHFDAEGVQAQPKMYPSIEGLQWHGCTHRSSNDQLDSK